MVEDLKRIFCSDKLPERVRLVCFALGARPVCPAKEKKFNNGLNAKKIIAGKGAT